MSNDQKIIRESKTKFAWHLFELARVVRSSEVKSGLGGMPFGTFRKNSFDFDSLM